MSQISSYATELVLEGVARGTPLEDDPGWDVLRRACASTAEELGYRG